MAVADVEEVADRLSSLVDAPVTVAFAAPSPHVAHIPSVAEAVSRTRGRVAVASHLLAPGLFQSRLCESGADVVARPLGLHPLIVDRACALAAQPVTV